MKRITYILMALFIILSLGLAGASNWQKPILELEENPLIWALVPLARVRHSVGWF